MGVGRVGALAIAALLVMTAPAAAQYTRVTVASNGAQANSNSVTPSISRNGRFVAFASVATNLVVGDQNDTVADIYVHDRDADGDGVFDEPGAIETLKASRFANGTDIPGTCDTPAISGDGRHTLFFTSQIDPSQPAGVRHLMRWDRVTGDLAVVDVTPTGGLSAQGAGYAAINDDGRLIVFTSASPDIVPGSQELGVYVRDMVANTTRNVSDPFRPLTGSNQFPGVWTTRTPGISADGRYTAWVDHFTLDNAVFNGKWSGTARVVDLSTNAPRRTNATAVRLSDDGVWLIGEHMTMFGGIGVGELFRYNLTTGERREIGRTSNGAIPSFSRDGRQVVTQLNGIGTLVDAPMEIASTLPFGTMITASFDATSRYMAFESADLLVAGDTNGAIDIFVVDLPQIFDVDHDTLDDRWERFFTLNPASSTGADGASGDPDGDGLTNAQEQTAGSHPRGLFKRYLAEGATGSFFRTYIAIANPGGAAAAATLTFARGDGLTNSMPLSVPSLRRRTAAPADLPDFAATQFSTVVESDRLLVVDRTMRWDTRGVFDRGNSINGATGYGAHSETAVDGPATQWFLAEGSTVIDFELFYLLQNPQTTPVDATIRYLRPSGAPIVRTYTLAPNSRTTIHVNDVDAALADSDVSGDISATAPIIVERSMYASRPGQPLALGHAARGVTAAATSWFLAEGATGPFFDTYVLIVNPTALAAAVDVRFDKPDGSSVIRHHTVAPNSRFSIYADSIPGLESTSMATTVTSTNAVPVIVERAMYWPNGFFDYYEGHVSPGVTSAGLRWALAEGDDVPTIGPSQSFILIANTASAQGRVRITPLLESGNSAPIEIDLPPNSRTTVPAAFAFSVIGRFGALVESIGASPVPIVVEGAFYWTIDDVLWAAGSNLVATRLP
jgi:hypothetical protein